jgi:hypothetical protein
MPVRKTESRIPDGCTAEDFGQSVASGDNQIFLISYIISPLVISRPNTYVVIVNNPTLAASTAGYAWSIAEAGAAPTVQATTTGQLTFTPEALGELTVSVKVLDNGNQELANLTLTQEVIETNAELEDLIITSAEQPGPGLGNIEVARELVNDHNPYYQSVSLQNPEQGDGFKQFVFSMASDGLLQRSPTQRMDHLNQLADALNGGTSDFVTLAMEGAGVCRVRLPMLAMVRPGGLPWTELPEATTQRAAADEQLRETLASLDENKKIDLFNLVRFPKSNITQCGKIIEELRNHYFAGANFNDVLTGMAGTRAHWISRHYREGPLLRE